VGGDHDDRGPAALLMLVAGMVTMAAVMVKIPMVIAKVILLVLAYRWPTG
jgi:hypothetical protein